jgi:hypothetical protein
MFKRIKIKKILFWVGLTAFFFGGLGTIVCALVREAPVYMDPVYMPSYRNPTIVALCGLVLMLSFHKWAE